jgi:hypothetical protein
MDKHQVVVSNWIQTAILALMILLAVIGGAVEAGSLRQGQLDLTKHVETLEQRIDQKFDNQHTGP